MNTLKLRVYQLRTVPLQVIVRKAARRLLNQFRVLIHYHKVSTRQPYATSNELPWDQPTHIRNLLSHSAYWFHTPECETTLHAIATHCLNGLWYIIGCGWIEPIHGVSVQGFHSHCYQYDRIDIEHLSNGTWLQQQLPDTAVPYGQWLWNLIEPIRTPFDWQRDFRSGYRWRASQWHERITLAAAPGADPKIPWEFGRLQLLPALAIEAYRSQSSRRSQLVRCVEDIMLDFAAQNPPGFGIQWASSMDVSIRLANMLVTLDLCSQLSMREDVRQAMVSYCYDHARFVLENLEWSEGMRGNHYLACIAGLSVAAAYFPECPWTTQLRQWCANQLAQEIQYQFMTEGSNFEASIAYHRLSAEMVGWALSFLRMTPEGYDILKDISFEHTLYRIYRFTLETTYNSYTAPQIGDNDSGRFLILTPYEESWIPDFPWSGHARPYLSQRSHRETLQLLATIVHDSQHYHQENKTFLHSKSYIAPSFGVSVLRNAPWEVFIRAGYIGQYGKGGHAHNDQLSITVAVDGQEIIVDPGTYVYLASPEWRNLFRSTAVHSTLQYANHEQNRWTHGSGEHLFWLTSDKAHGRILVSDNHVVVAEHSAYRLPHRRIVACWDDMVTIDDLFPHPDRVRIRFHLHPQITIIPIDSTRAILRCGKLELFVEVQDAFCSFEEGYYSHSYGVLCGNNCLVFKPKKCLVRTSIRLEKRA